MKTRFWCTILICTMFSIPPICTIYTGPTSRSCFTPSDSSGPEFLDVTSQFYDSHQDMAPVSDHLFLHVTVYDEDGIDTVIGSYSEVESDTWNNITMQFAQGHGDGQLEYNTTGPSYTLDLSNRTKQYNVQYYANDTLGNWNASEIVLYSDNILVYPSSSFRQMEILTVISLSVIILMVIRTYIYRRKRST